MNERRGAEVKDAVRDLAKLIEVAALDQKLKSFGHDSSVEFNKKLLKIMRDKRIN